MQLETFAEVRKTALVDEWRMVPPTDPFLLRRITINHFVVLAGWDLTPLEKSVMQSHL